MAAKLVMPVRREEKEIPHGVAGSMWRPGGVGRVDEDDDSWEARAFADDAAGLMGGGTWPPRSYSCSFCRREFRSAQALGGHMNVHRRDRARLRQSSPSGVPQDHHHHHHPGGSFPSSAVMATQEFPFYVLYPVQAPHSSSDQNSLVYALKPNSSLMPSPTPTLMKASPHKVIGSDSSDHENFNSNLVEFIPPSLQKLSPSSSSSSPPSTVLSISAYSPSELSPVISNSPTMNNISSSTDSSGVSGSERSRRSDFAPPDAELPGKSKQNGAFHPYLRKPSRRDRQIGSSEDHFRALDNIHDMKGFNLGHHDFADDVDLELRLGQTKD